MLILQCIFVLLWSIQNPFYISVQRDYPVYINRICKMGKNKITLKPPCCMYCKGYGYFRCGDCDNGCWRCSQSTLIYCKFCVGDGKGRYAYREIKK